jgi:hypothetical protein
MAKIRRLSSISYEKRWDTTDVIGPFNLEFTQSVAILVDKLYAEISEKGPLEQGA